MGKASAHRFFCWTCNNYTPEDEVRLQKMKIVGWLLYGHEIGPENGVPHLQGALWCTKPMYLANLGRMMKNCWASGMGSEKDLAHWLKYCTKDGVDIVEVGIRPTAEEVDADIALQGQGSRSDLVTFRDTIRDNGKVTKRELWDNHPSIMARYPKVASEIRNVYHPPQKLTVRDNQCIYGPSQCGKTTTAEQENPDHWCKTLPGLWFDGYNYEEVIIWEDFGKDEFNCNSLLKNLADYKPCTVGVKGSTLVIRPRRIIVTSNYHPQDIWTDSETLQPILERFTIRHFHDKSFIPECYRKK